MLFDIFIWALPIASGGLIFSTVFKEKLKGDCLSLTSLTIFILSLFVITGKWDVTSDRLADLEVLSSGEPLSKKEQEDYDRALRYVKSSEIGHLSGVFKVTGRWDEESKSIVGGW